MSRRWVQKKEAPVDELACRFKLFILADTCWRTPAGEYVQFLRGRRCAERNARVVVMSVGRFQIC